MFEKMTAQGLTLDQQKPVTVAMVDALISSRDLSPAFDKLTDDSIVSVRQ